MPKLYSLRLFAATALLFLFSGSVVFAQDIPAEEREPFTVHMIDEEEVIEPEFEWRDGPLKVVGLEDNPALKRELEGVAWKARRNVRETTRVDWDGTALIIWIEDENEYVRRTGHRPEFTAAAANARRATVMINAKSWRRSSPEERLQVMTHEIGHLLVGNLPGGRKLPLWAEEGIVMHLADEWTFQRSMKVSQAHAFGQLPRLEELELRFPRDPEGQSLAYAISYLAIEQIAQNLGDDPGTVSRLMKRLADEERGPKMNERFWNRAERAGWNDQMIEGIGGRVTNFLIILSSGTILWLLIIGLVMIAWWKKKKRRLAVARAELEAEPWAESLTDEDIQDIWGDKEERYGTTDELPWEKWERLKAEEDERW